MVTSPYEWKIIELENKNPKQINNKSYFFHLTSDDVSSEAE